VSDVVIGFDTGPGVGLGHQRRMETLARALQRRGRVVELRPLDDAALAAPTVVIDSYRVRGDDRSRVRGERVVAVDDLVRDLAVDVVVDPCPGATASEHPAAGAVLAGAEYALLGIDAPPRVDPPDGDCRSVVVTAGGTGTALAQDLRGELAAALGAGVVVRAVGPPAATPGAPLAADLLGAADLVVTAAGVTMLEALALGRPTVAFVLAANQSRQLAGAAAAGAVVASSPERLVADAVVVATDAGRRVELSARARALVDGGGADRVAAALAEERSGAG